MIRKLARLLAPLATDGGGAVDTMESDPSGVSGWMQDLPSLQTVDKKEPDGTTTAKPPGADGTGGGTPPVDRAAAPAAPAAKPAATPAKPDSAVDAGKPKPNDTGAPTDKKAADAKATEKPADETEKETWPRTSGDWAKFKTKHAEKEAKLQQEIAAREQKVQELQTQIKTFEEKAAQSGEIPQEVKIRLERAEAENAEMSKRLIALDVTQHPKFQAHFGGRIDEQKSLAKSIVGDEKSEALDKILTLPNGEYKNQQLEEFVSDLPVLQQARLGSVLNNLDAIERERKAEIDKAGTHRATLDAKQKEDQKNMVALREKLVKQAITELQDPKNGMAIFQHQEGDEAWNKGVDERINTAKRLLTGEGLKPDDLVRAAFHATAFPDVLKMWADNMEEKDGTISKLEAQVSALTAAQPGATGGGGAAAGGDVPQPRTKIEVGMTPGEVMGAFTKGLGGMGG